MSDDARMTVPDEGGKHRRQDEPIPEVGAPLAASTVVEAPDGSDAVAPATVDGVAAPGVVARKAKRKPLTFWQELPLLVALAVVLAVLIKTFAFQAFVIPSESMESTIMTNDRVMTNKLVYDFRDPHRGEVVVFERTGAWPELTNMDVPKSSLGRVVQDAGKFIGFVPSGTDFIKRVIGLPGDTIACCDAQNRMLVNGQPLDESAYVQGSSAQMGWKGPVTVPAGELFVMGDNREHSSDARVFGTVPINKVVGRAVFVMWPREHWKGLRVPATVEQFSTPPSGAMGALPSLGAVALVLPLAGLRARRRRRLRRPAA
ncbi:MAG: signal peptidase [Frankiaceae bacterium]|nr:signal peptidase [Frankiaceae bacterium]